MPVPWKLHNNTMGINNTRHDQQFTCLQSTNRLLHGVFYRNNITGTMHRAPTLVIIKHKYTGGM